MPYKKKYKKRRKRRHNKRNKVNTLVVRGPTIVPDQMFTKLTYRSNTLNSEPNGGFTTNVYRGNSIFDPEFGAASGQPLGRDQWQAFYGKYQVMASRITIRFLPTSNQGSNYSICLLPTTDASPGGIAEMQEQPYAKSSLMSRVADNPHTLSSYMKSGAIFGTNNILAEEDTQANQANNPTQEWFWVIGASNNLLAGPGQKELDVYVEIDYYVRYFDRKNLERS